MPRERIIVFETIDERDLPVREPAAELELAGTGPTRGTWEEAREVAAEYTPPGRDA
jgi:hypothetical protein